MYGAHFEVWTDNNPLTYVLTSAKLDATGHRWLAKLASFDFSIKYKSGKTNTNADSLSRIPETCAEITKAICNASELETDFVSCMSMSPDVVSEFESCSDVVEQLDISQLQLDDPDIAKIIEWKRCGHIPSKDELKHVSDCVIRLARDLNKLSFVNNVLVKNVHTDENEIRVIVLPKSCIDIVLHELHDNIGHPGGDRNIVLN